MNKKNIEELATGAVKNSIITSKYLNQYISENDKETLIDGSVDIHGSTEKTKKDILGKVHIQVKGTLQREISHDEINYPVEVGALHYYYDIGGIVFFVVYISKDYGKSCIYYNTLTPVKLTSILESCKNQKTKRLKFIPFPADSNSKSTIFLQFFTDCKKQRSFKPDNMLSLDDINKVKEITMSVNGFGLCNQDPQQVFLVNETYLYGKLNDNISIPIKAVPIKMSFIEEVNGSITINGKEYYSKYTIVRSSNTLTVKIGNSFSILITNTEQEASVSYKDAKMLSDSITDTDFIINLTENGKFSFNGKEFPMSASDEEIKKFNINSHKESLEYLRKVKMVFDLLNVKKDLDLSLLTRQEMLEISNLVTAFIDGKPVDNLKPKIDVVAKLKIQNIVLLLVFQKVDGTEGTYIITDFSKSNLYVTNSLDNEEEKYITSKYSLLQANDYAEIDNFDYVDVISSYRALDQDNASIGIQGNADMLRIITAYDMSGKTELLELAKQISEWISTLKLYDPNDYNVRIVNQLQIIKRQREFTYREEEILCSITESSDVNDEIKTGAYLLLDNENAAKLHFNKLTAEGKKRFIQYPIYHFWNKENTKV